MTAPEEFQCSSASRKFLKRSIRRRAWRSAQSFSALQRAENSSNVFSAAAERPVRAVSVLFSEPKIPQSVAHLQATQRAANVSVLFSEPKIPQNTHCAAATNASIGFSALQRAENSSKKPRLTRVRLRLSFSALQRAENSSNDGDERGRVTLPPFQCSSASRKFLKRRLRSSRRSTD